MEGIRDRNLVGFPMAIHRKWRLQGLPRPPWLETGRFVSNRSWTWKRRRNSPCGVSNVVGPNEWYRILRAEKYLGKCVLFFADHHLWWFPSISKPLGWMVWSAWISWLGSQDVQQEQFKKWMVPHPGTSKSWAISPQWWETRRSMKGKSLTMVSQWRHQSLEADARERRRADVSESSEANSSPPNLFHWKKCWIAEHLYEHHCSDRYPSMYHLHIYNVILVLCMFVWVLDHCRPLNESTWGC